MFERCSSANISYACASPGDISMLALLAIIQQCGGFHEASTTMRKAQRVIHGVQPIADTPCLSSRATLFGGSR